MTQPTVDQPPDSSAALVDKLVKARHPLAWHMWQFLRMLLLGLAPEYNEADIKEIYAYADADTRKSDMASYREQMGFFHNELQGMTGTSGVAATLISLLFTTLALALGQGRGLMLLWVLGAFLCVGVSICILIRMTMQRTRVLWTNFYHPLERARIRRNEEEEYLFLFDKEWRLMAVVQFLKRGNVLSGILAILGLAQLLVYTVLQAKSLL